MVVEVGSETTHDERTALCPVAHDFFIVVKACKSTYREVEFDWLRKLVPGKIFANEQPGSSELAEMFFVHGAVPVNGGLPGFTMCSIIFDGDILKRRNALIVFRVHGGLFVDIDSTDILES